LVMSPFKSSILFLTEFIVIKKRLNQNRFRSVFQSCACNACHFSGTL
jgi:hypothetical protein